MTDPISRKGQGFISSPFQDQFFASVATHFSFEDRRNFNVKPDTYNARFDPDHPSDMPIFSFCEGAENYDGFLSIQLCKKPYVTYIHSSLAHPHLTVKKHEFPESIWQSLQGKSLNQLLDLPFADRWQIAATRIRPTNLLSSIDIKVEPLE